MKLELDGLTKEFGDFTAVNHINLTMTNGVYGLLGVSRSSAIERHSSELSTNVGSQITSESRPEHSLISSAPRFSLIDSEEKFFSPLAIFRPCFAVKTSSPILGAKAIRCSGFAKLRKNQSSLYAK